MKKEIFLWITVILLLIFNLSLIYKNKENKKQLHVEITRLNEWSEKAENARWEMKILKETMMLQQMSEATSCAGIEIKGLENKELMTLGDLLKEKGNLLIFRFKENQCDACMQNATMLLTEMSEHLPRQGIAILSGYSNVRQFYSYAQAHKGKFNVFNADLLPVAAENQEQPYFFVITPDMKIQNVFIVNKNEPELTSEYLHCMGHKYWNVHLTDHDHSSIHH